MKTRCSFVRPQSVWLFLLFLGSVATRAIASETLMPEIGLAVRNITPELPIRLAGYAARKRPADKVDHPLLVQALTLRNPSGERCVFVALDNCEVSRAFMQPVLE